MGYTLLIEYFSSGLILAYLELYMGELISLSYLKAHERMSAPRLALTPTIVQEWKTILDTD